MAKIIIFLFQIGFFVKFNIVGSISLSELFLLGSSFYYIRKTDYRSKEISSLTKLYIFLFIVQIFSELVVGNSVSNSLKGLAITIVSYLHVIFLHYYFKRDSSLVVYAILGTVCNLLLYGDLTSAESMGDLSSSGFVYLLKFRIAPIVLSLVAALSVIKRNWNIELIAVLTGLAFIGLGARSSGLIIFLAGMISILVKYKKKIGVKSYTPIIIFSIFLFYIGYIFYVNQVIDGKIKSGNSDQMLRLENPYNPVNLLLTGRTETFVGAIAFMDKPLTGWGAWSADPNWKYHYLGASLGNKEFRIENENNVDVIPSHSVVVGYAMQNGVFALIAIMLIVSMIVKMAIYSINRRDPYNYLLIYFLVVLCWNGLFSPLSHFRSSLPLCMTFLLIRHQVNKYKKKSMKTINNEKNSSITANLGDSVTLHKR